MTFLGFNCPSNSAALTLYRSICSSTSMYNTNINRTTSKLRLDVVGSSPYSVQYDLSASKIIPTETTCYLRGCWNGINGAGGGGLESAPPVNWRLMDTCRKQRVTSRMRWC